MRSTFSIAVKDFVAFMLRAGDLSSGAFGGLYRAREGVEGHNRVRRGRPEGYRSEVAVRRRFEDEDIAWELAGRIDGLFTEDGRTVVEEIKTTREPFDLLAPEDPLHWAQAMVYGHLLAVEEGLDGAAIQLTYFHLDSGDVRPTRRWCTAAGLAEFFEPLRQRYTAWLRRVAGWRRLRDASLAALQFPFETCRPGQAELSQAVDDAIRGNRRLFAEAPTGIGKTAAVLCPALRALGQAACDCVFFLTARTPGRLIAEQTLERMRARGLLVKALTITARDRICFCDAGACDPEACPFARNFFDRLDAARIEAFAQDRWDRAFTEALARKHQLCPFALQLELLPWADLVVCDYNYAFDPGVALSRLAGPEAARCVLLVDEAHNLLDRARDMFSAGVREADFSTLAAALPARPGLLRRAATRAAGAIAAATDGPTPRAEDAAPEDLLAALAAFVTQADAWLVGRRPAPFRERLLQCCFDALAFLRAAERGGAAHRLLLVRTAAGSAARLFCVDPAPLLRDTWKRSGAAVLFSATLTPLPFFREALGGSTGDPLLELPSPFPAEHLGLIVAAHVPTEYRRRSGSVAEIAALIDRTITARPGAYLAYFPSYEYLGAVRGAFTALRPDVPAPAQEPAMSDEARLHFLDGLLHCPPGGMIAFAVLGGIFAEGIDLPGGVLAGILVVGVGLPQICIERDEIRKRSDAAGADGFAVAYAYPGFNRVLQAAGRLIRSETDAGIVVLIDRRFARADYGALFPAHWRHARRVMSRDELSAAIRAFSGHPGL